MFNISFDNDSEKVISMRIIDAGVLIRLNSIHKQIFCFSSFSTKKRTFLSENLPIAPIFYCNVE